MIPPRTGQHPAISPRPPHGPSLATQVVSAPSALVLALWAEPVALLTGAEQHRASRFRFVRDRRDFVAAHVLARVAGAGVLGVDPGSLTLVQRCDRCGEPHGVPSFAEAPGVGVSVSHTRGYVAAAVGPGQVGVDTEGTASGFRLDEGLASYVLAPGERALLAAAPDRRHAFVRLWVRKEAMVKCGRGSLDDLSAVDVSTTPLVDLSSAPACIRDGDGQFLLEWQDPEQGVLGAAVTAQPPRLAILRRGQVSPEFQDVPVVTSL
ncbi:MAG: 4'-phosphopantetheinyl transferase superfamily protein [Actinomycetota bacterium]|nr:4'-phosphopantetheinyl transferase superfamily protein [Actinomycetota bacterium]